MGAEPSMFSREDAFWKFLANAEYQKVRVWDHQVLEIPQLSNTVQTHVAVRTETVAMSARLAVRRYGKVER